MDLGLRAPEGAGESSPLCLALPPRSSGAPAPYLRGVLEVPGGQGGRVVQRVPGGRGYDVRWSSTSPCLKGGNQLLPERSLPPLCPSGDAPTLPASPHPGLVLVSKVRPKAQSLLVPEGQSGLLSGHRERKRGGEEEGEGRAGERGRSRQGPCSKQWGKVRGSHSPGGPGDPFHLGRHSLLLLPGAGGRERNPGVCTRRALRAPHSAGLPPRNRNPGSLSGSCP